MNVWKLTAANNLVKSEEDPRPAEGKRRVRVTKVYLTREDAAIFKGTGKLRYPLVPGRYAVGIVYDEEGGPLFRKGTHVLLHNYLPAEDTGTGKKSFTEDDFRVLGKSDDGFLRDFVYVREDEMTPLPDAVHDEKALLLHSIALAQSTVETLDVQRGEHIAVIGCNLLGLFVARLLIYRQAAPILIDNRPDRLDFARTRGVYYTALPDDSLMDMVGTVTGGRLADGVVFIPAAGEGLGELPAAVCAAGKHIAYCGPCGDRLSLSLEEVIKKRLTVHGVLEGTENLEVAINLIANKAIDLTGFKFQNYPSEMLVPLLNILADDPDLPIDTIHLVNLV